ncbi:MAG TPA: RecT family recombinase [Ignavibacteriales bacterium]|nr:RecT family recombinase [Ignavibacteriales bacterium]
MAKQNLDPANGQDAKPSTAVTVQEKNIADNILNRVNELEKKGGLVMPANYSAANALKSAWLILQNTQDKEKRPVLQSCTKESIANALLDMVVQGLSPIKKQCYFVAYGNALTLSRSYQGTIVATKRLKGVKEVFANCIYEGDQFEYIINLNTGFKEITKHEQKFENIDPVNIKGAYAIITREGLPPYVEIMNIKQIRDAWGMGKSYGNANGSKAHDKFSDEMAKKTVINRACKSFLNTSDDSDLLIGAINNTKDIEEMPNTPYEDLPIEEELKEKANKEMLDIPQKTIEAKASTTSAPAHKEAAQQTAAEPTLDGPGF